jgi:hypothetical protein
MLLRGLVSILLMMATPLSAQHKTVLTLTWTNTSGSFPTCSPKVHIWCLLGQTVTDTTNAGASRVLSAALDPRASSYTYKYNYADFPSGTTRTYSISLQYCGAVPCTVSTALNTASMKISVKCESP